VRAVNEVIAGIVGQGLSLTETLKKATTTAGQNGSPTVD
jgi:hypothetical protein